jgi:hypothetical protein
MKKKLFWLVLILGVIIFLIAQDKQDKTSIVIEPTPTIVQTQSVLGVQTKSINCKTDGPYPDKECTPGAIFKEVTKEQICTPGYSQNVRNVSKNIKNKVYEEYDIYSHKTGEYEVDHFIPLELGGSNDIANLFPEAAEPKPGFHEKDKVENYLHRQVCAGMITLEQAQIEIVTDWVKILEAF